MNWKDCKHLSVIKFHPKFNENKFYKINMVTKVNDEFWGKDINNVLMRLRREDFVDEWNWMHLNECFEHFNDPYDHIVDAIEFRDEHVREAAEAGAYKSIAVRVSELEFRLNDIESRIL